jgi:hypothetical protein
MFSQIDKKKTEKKKIELRGFLRWLPCAFLGFKVTHEVGDCFDVNESMDAP